MPILSILFAAVFIYYLRYIFLFYKGLDREYQNFREDEPFVSVIVAARNEEQTLPGLLPLLIEQNYDTDKYEIIIADDQSTDKTAQIVRDAMESCDNLHLLSVEPPQPGVSRKKNALAQAVEKSQGEIILATDADCKVKPSWIKTMVKYFSENVGFVAGLSLTQPAGSANLVETFEFFDMVVLFTAAAGAIGVDKPFSCSGQNLAYTREAFDEVNGYKKVKNHQSGDDVLLMQLIQNAGHKIRFAFDERAYNSTVSEKNLVKFLNQRIRWASNEKPQSKLNKEFFFYLVDVFLLNLLLVVTLFIEPSLFFIFFIIKAIFEIFLLNKGRKTFSLGSRVMWLYPIWAIFNPIYIILTAIGEKLHLFRWK